MIDQLGDECELFVSSHAVYASWCSSSSKDTDNAVSTDIQNLPTTEESLR